MSKLSVVIPYENDALIGHTVESARRAEPGCEVIAKNDKELGIGCGRCRDAGIVEADGEYIMCADAHMTFQNGVGSRMIEVIEANGGIGICCCDCTGLDTKTMGTNDRHRYGANFIDSRRHPEHGRQIFVSQWRYDHPGAKVAEVPMVLGACYVFRKDWYIDGMRRPWKHHMKWGKIEQLLSVANFVYGGRAWCRTDRYAAHLFKGGSAKRIKYLNYNAALLAYSYMTTDEREALFAKASTDIKRNLVAWRNDNSGLFMALRREVKKNSVKTYSDYLKNCAKNTCDTYLT